MAYDPKELESALENLLKVVKGGTSSRATRRTATDDSDSSDVPASLQKQNEVYKIQKELIEEIYSGEQKREELRSEKQRALKQMQRTLEDALEAEIKAGKKNSEEAKRYIADLKTINKELKEVENNTSKASEAFKKIAGNIKDMGMEAGKAYFNIKGLYTPEMAIGMIKQMDAAQASFAKTTGAGRKYKEEMVALQKATADLGTQHEDAARVFSNLSTTIVGFNDTSLEFRSRAAEMARSLEQLGVPSKEFSTVVNTLNTNLGVSKETAIDLEENLVHLARSIGKTASEVNSDLTSNLNRLAIYGSNAGKQFEGLERQAHLAGTQVSTLTDLTEKLSTFEGAGEFAGRLNALAGMDLFDVGQLVNLEGAEKIQYIVENIQRAGLDLNDPKVMRAVTQASGIDPQTFKGLANLTGDKLAKAIREQEDLKKEKSVRDLAKEAATGEERAAGKTTARMTEAVGGAGAVDTYLQMNDKLDKTLDSLGGKILFLAGTITALAGAVAANMAGGFLKDKIGGIFKGGGAGNLPVPASAGSKTVAEAGKKSIGNLSEEGTKIFKEARASGKTAKEAYKLASGAERAGLEATADVGGKVAAGGAKAAAKGALKTALKFLGPALDVFFTYKDIKDAIETGTAGGKTPDDGLKKTVGEIAVKGGANTILNGLLAFGGPIGIGLSIVNGLAGAFGWSAGDVLVKGLNKLGIAEDFMKGVGGVLTDKMAPDNKSSTALKPDEKGEDVLSSPGLPVIKTAAGKLISGTQNDTAMLVDFTKAGRNSGNNDDKMYQAMMALANRPLVIQANGREIARLANAELRPQAI